MAHQDNDFEAVRDGALHGAQPSDPIDAEQISPAAAAFAKKAKNLDDLRSAVVDAAGVGAGLWFSYLFVLFYFLIAVGGVTHRDLFFESAVKLPFLNVDLPLVGFFVLGPALFIVAHAYVLMHFVLLADKVGMFHAELKSQITDEEVRGRLRRQLPSNVFVQILAGPREVREGVFGFMLRLIAQITLVAGPVALLVFFQLQFLPYHHEAISWWQRIAVLADLALLWALWPSVASGSMMWITWRDLRRRNVMVAAVASLGVVFLVFGIATFPGELLDANLPALHVSGYLRGTSLHKLLVAGDIDLVARKPRSLWSTASYSRALTPSTTRNSTPKKSWGRPPKPFPYARAISRERC
jgi:hypothetical protein